MDTPVQVLRATRVGQASFFRGAVPWNPLAGEPPLVACLVLRGQGVAAMPGGRGVLVRTGELAIFPAGMHHWRADPGTDATGCVLACDAWLVRTLFASLPCAVVRPIASLPAGRWVEATLQYGAVQDTPATTLKLAEALLAELLPMCLPECHACEGWLAGVGDRIVGKVLGAIHAQPGCDWTLDSLARLAHTSRSVLAERFLQLMGRPPIQYLAQWRLALAASLLATTDAPLSRIASDVGYQTDTAFIRAFRRHYGQPPAAWRRAHGRAAPDARAVFPVPLAGHAGAARDAMESPSIARESP
jgi:AraC-like DNA-binding protein